MSMPDTPDSWAAMEEERRRSIRESDLCYEARCEAIREEIIATVGWLIDRHSGTRFLGGGGDGALDVIHDEVERRLHERKKTSR